MATVEVKVPDIGDFKDVEIIEVLVKPGDRIKAEQSLVTVESDKASMEIPSSAAGVVKEMRVKLGDKISEGSSLLVLESEGGAQPAAAACTGPAPAAAAAARAGTFGSPVSARRGSAAAAGPIEVVVPDIGDFNEVAVIEVLVKPGDSVEAEQSLITVESDKASMEIPSSHAGVVQGAQGQGRRQGVQGHARSRCCKAPAAPRRPPAAGRPGAARRAAARRRAAAPAAAAPPAGARRRSRRPRCRRTSRPRRQGALPHASPTIRKLARELGVPLAEVKGSGPKGRITQEDVQAFVKAVMAGASDPGAGGQGAGARRAAGGGAFPGLLPWPQVDFAKFGPIEKKDAVAHQEDQRRRPASQLGRDPARHQPRRCRHHRARGVPRRQPTRRTRSRASRSRCSPS